MENVWITYHGYDPVRGGLCPTGTFKDLEAVVTLQRMLDRGCSGIIVATAGNTGRSFAHFGGLLNVPTLIIVAEQHLQRIWLPKGHPSDSVILVGIKDADYNDAITLSKQVIEQLDGFQLEGGVFNVARRDGIGSLMLAGVEAIGRLPDHYFQAVGGGPGPIGCFEMAKRLVDTGQESGSIPQFHLSQNIEHCPIHNAWQAERSQLIEEDFPDKSVEVYSDYLVNRTPAYGMIGGLYDVLKSTSGETYTVTRDEAESAAQMYFKCEGIDTLSPAAVALASLVQAKESGNVSSSDVVLLNISGGGVQQLKKDKEIEPLAVNLLMSKGGDINQIIELFKERNLN
jgi:cysteate synthase